MLRYPAEEILGKHIRDFTHVDDWQASATVYGQVLANSISIQSLEKRYLRRDGSILWGNLTLSLLRDTAGKPQSFIAAIEDITARKQAEETFDSVPDMILVLDRQHRIVRANRAAAKRLGCLREELFGRHCYQVMHATLAPPESCVPTGNCSPTARSTSSRRMNRG